VSLRDIPILYFSEVVVKSSKSVFKYREFNKSSIELLVNRELWFAKPSTFNDPFECIIDLDYIFSKVKIFDENDKKIAKTLINKSLNNTGICSFSRTRKNQLMWSHYADEHRGFCIGFDSYGLATQEIGALSQPVDYSINLPYEDIIESLQSNGSVNKEQAMSDLFSCCLLPIIGTKYSNWKYEKEIRLVKTKYGASSFKPSAVRSIAFGLRMEERDRNTLKQLLSSEEWRHVMWYEAIKVDTKFALEFRRVKI